MGEADFGSSLPLSSQLELEQREQVGLGAQLLAVVPMLSLVTAAKSVVGCVCPSKCESVSQSKNKDEEVEDREHEVPFLNLHFL